MIDLDKIDTHYDMSVTAPTTWLDMFIDYPDNAYFKWLDWFGTKEMLCSKVDNRNFIEYVLIAGVWLPYHKGAFDYHSIVRGVHTLQNDVDMGPIFETMPDE